MKRTGFHLSSGNADTSHEEDAMTTYAAGTRRHATRGIAGRPLTFALVAMATPVLLLAGNVPDAAAVVRFVNNNAPMYSQNGQSCDNAGYSAIQTAVNAALPSDVIKVCPGAYSENVVIGTKNLTVTTTALFPPATVVKALVSTPVFTIAATGVVLDGFTIVPGGFADGDIGVNVAIKGPTGAQILGNAVLGGRIGVNLGCVSFHTVVANNTVNGQSEGGINIDTCELTRDPSKNPGAHDNLIHHNVACSTTATASIALGGSSNNNRIHDNVATTISSWGKGNRLEHNVTQLPIIDNSQGSNIVNDNTDDLGVCSITSP